MAIHIIFGRGGSGKSAFQMHVVMEQLRFSRRNICTNLSIDLGRLNAYVERKYPGESIDVVGRIRLLSVSECEEFWKYRGPVTWDSREGHEYDMIENKGLQGTCYIIDEAGVAGFSATLWAQKVGNTTRGASCLWYLDQQRKFGDDVYASTNGIRPAGIAKGFRDKAHYFIKLKNGYQTTYGMFRARGRFTWYKFTSEPVGKDSEPMAEGRFEMDPDGLMGCYRTEDGVGITGVAADKGQRAKGIPIMYIFPMLIGLGLVLASVPWLLGKGVQYLFVKPKVQKVASVKPVAGPTQSNVGSAVLDTGLPEVRVTGYVMDQRGPMVMLSDGSTVGSAEGLQKVDRNGIVLKGVRIPFAQYHYTQPIDRSNDQLAAKPKPVGASGS